MLFLRNPSFEGNGLYFPFTRNTLFLIIFLIAIILIIFPFCIALYPRQDLIFTFGGGGTLSFTQYNMKIVTKMKISNYRIGCWFELIPTLRLHSNFWDALFSLHGFLDVNSTLVCMSKTARSWPLSQSLA